MKTLSIRNPWAWLIVNGLKNIENRTWKTKYRGEFLIHAGKKIEKVPHWVRILINDDRQFSTMLSEIALQAGGIVGRAEVVDCVQESDSPWFEGPNGFVLENAKVLPFYPCKGKLSFFEIDYPW